MMRQGTISFILLLLISACTDVSVLEKPAGPPVLDYVDIQPRVVTEFEDSILITIRYSDPDGDLDYVDIQPRVVTEFEDSILITIRYSDPDGDLGYENPDVRSLSIHDLRLEKPDSQHVSLLAPIESHIDIEGELVVKLKNTFLLGSSEKEITSYELILTDRAGNQSNPITTDEISIERK